jgi:TPR repeat protein
LVLAVVVVLLPACKGDIQAALPDGASAEMQQEARLCDRGEPTACNNVGAMYEDGEGFEPDPARAATLYQQACGAGASLACVNLADLTIAGHGDGSPTEILRLACETREQTACLRLGQLYADKEGAFYEPVLARQNLQTACESNIMAGCVGWADLLAAGEGGEADLDQAHHLYQRTCGNAFPDGCARWGEVLLTGPEALRDPRMGAAQLERACANDVASACMRLSRLQRSGSAGVEPDYSASDFHRRRACDLGEEAWCAAPSGLVLLRHAEAWKNVNAPPEMNEDDLEQLTPLGRAQAQSWAGWDSGRELSSLMASAAPRAQGTARPIADALSLHLTPADEFAPVPAGLSTSDGVALLWSDLVAAMRAGQSDAGEGGTPLAEAGAAALGRVSDLAPAEFRIAVTHGDRIVGILLAVGMDAESAIQRMPGHASAVLVENLGGEWTFVSGAGPFSDWPELPPADAFADPVGTDPE